MALPNTTVAEVSANIIAKLEASLNQTIPLLPKSFNRVIAKALGAVVVTLYKYCGFIFLQMFVATAQDKDTEIYGQVFNPLVAHGDLIGVTAKTAATRAEKTVAVNVINQVGSLPSGTQLVSDLNGVTYLTIGDTALSAAVVYPTIRAVSDQSGGDGSGEIGNLQIGDEVNFVNPLGDVDRITSVNSIIVTGADGETTEAYRKRIQDAFSARPQGGAYSDYRAWGSAEEGIAQIFVYTSETKPGQVDVFVESSTTDTRIPTEAQLSAVAVAIELNNEGLASRRPVSALVNTKPVTVATFDTQVVGLSSVDNIAEVQNDITTAVQQYFLNRAPFISGLDVPPRRSNIQQAEVQGTVADIVSGAGGIFVSANVTESSSPIIVRSLANGELAVSGTVTFTAT
jgi:uncharacterized phage protein gp47/JayE